MPTQLPNNTQLKLPNSLRTTLPCIAKTPQDIDIKLYLHIKFHGSNIDYRIFLLGKNKFDPRWVMTNLTPS